MGRQPCWTEAVCAHILVAGVDPSVLLHIGLETVASGPECFLVDLWDDVPQPPVQKPYRLQAHSAQNNQFI